MLSNLRIILSHTSHPGNIGAAARAMKTMALHRLFLVNPRRFPDAEANARAVDADDILAQAVVVTDLNEALKDCGLVLGASARLRNLAVPMLNARECAELLAQELQHTEVALILGREDAGLTNEELQRCHYQVHIPCNPDFKSLNVAAALQVLAYEIYMACHGAPERVLKSPAPVATADEMADFYRHLEEVLIAIGFLDPAVPRRLMPRLRRLYNRARVDKVEINILRGMLTAMQHKMSQKP